MSTKLIKVAVDVEPDVAIRAGRSKFGRITGTVDISSLNEQEREELLKSHYYNDSEGNGIYVLNSSFIIRRPPSFSDEYLTFDALDCDLDTIRRVLNERIKLRRDMEVQFYNYLWNIRQNIQKEGVPVRYVKRYYQGVEYQEAGIDWEKMSIPSQGFSLIYNAVSQDPIIAEKLKSAKAQCEEANRQEEAAAKAQAEAAARADREAREKEKAEAERKIQEENEYLRRWIEENGTGLQREKLRRGLLSRAGMIEVLRELLFAPLENTGMRPYEKLTVEGTEYEELRIRFITCTPEEVDDAVFERFLRMEQLVEQAGIRNATCSIVEHLAYLEDDGQETYDDPILFKLSARVSIQEGPFGLYKDYEIE